MSFPQPRNTSTQNRAYPSHITRWRSHEPNPEGPGRRASRLPSQRSLEHLGSGMGR